VRAVNLEAQGHQDVPFEQVVERLKPRRSSSYGALFQIMFNMDTSKANSSEKEEGRELAGLAMMPLTRARVAAQFDLMLDVIEHKEGLRLSFIYNTALFEAATIARMGGRLKNLLRGVVANPEARIEELPLLSEAEREHLLYELNRTGVEYPRNLCVHELFEAQVQRTPDVVAVVSERQQLSYRDLNRKAERLARYLTEAGVELGSRVGIYLRRSVEMMIGVLGVLKTGGTYVPLEPGLPKTRLEYMLANAGIEWVLVDSKTMADLPLGGVDVVLMDGAGADADWLEEMESVEGAQQEKSKIIPECLAYILYTSGSTGRPKGVMVHHRALMNYLAHAVREYLQDGITASVVSSPLCFDATLTTLLPPLLAGGHVELLPENERLLHSLAEQLFADETEIKAGTSSGKLFKLTPSHLEALEYIERPAKSGSAAHRIIIGGEQLGAQKLRRWKQELLPNAIFVNEYGPTETVVGCSVWVLKDDAGLKELEGTMAAPIGKPIGNTQLYVLGEAQQLQPLNCAGELYIGGEGVARGYLDQEELTRERFIITPWGRLYRTGDIVRWLNRSELLFIGRRDDQVKVRGFRVELREIEAALLEHTAVEQAIVVAREDTERLAAYLIPGNGYPEKSDEEQVALKPGLVRAYREWLLARLPEYMVPSSFVLLKEFPLTVNGKVDRRALPQIEEADGQAGDYIRPRNGIEQDLCDVWQSVLKRERVGVKDNFFTLGGDSILSLRTVAMLKARGIELAVNDIFQHQTIERLALQAQNRSKSATFVKLEPLALLTKEERLRIEAETYDDAYPMSMLQAGMVFHTQLEQFNSIYHDIMTEHVKCPWEPRCFEQALASCIRQYPVLRTGFRLDGERPLQHVHAAIVLPLEVEDLCGQSEEEQNHYLAQWIEARKLHVFDWERGPLFQINIFLRTEETFEFVISFHHSVLDGWSRAALTTTLYNRYERLLCGEQPADVEVDWTYRDFIAQEQQVLGNPEALKYFAGMLEEAPMEQLPRTKSINGEAKQARLVVEEFNVLSERLLALARELGVPVQSVLLAAHFKVLSVMSGEPRAVTCVTHNGRPEQNGAEMGLGMFLNSLPQAVELTTATWRSLVEKVAALNAASMRYRGYPLSKIQQDLNWPFSEVLFNYTHFHVYSGLARRAGKSLEVLESTGFEQTNFDLLVDVARGLDDRMRLALIYKAHVYDEEWIVRLGQYYVRAFRQMIEGLDKLHHQQALLSQQEVQQLLRSGNADAASPPPNKCLHELFEEQVRRNPNAVAVVYGEQRLTYSELNQYANQLAHYLHARGVRPETLVGLCLERSLEMVLAILGTLKAGGAYVPLEPGYPHERLQYMLADSRPALLLTQASVAERLAGSAIPMLRLDADRDLLQSYATDNLSCAAGLKPSHLAYVIYTSGSTGRPKGVMVEHRHVHRLLVATDADFHFSERDVWTLFHSFAFDFSVWELWGALSYGGRLVVVPQRIARSADDFYHLLRRQRVTVLNQTPSAFMQLAQVDASRNQSLNLRVVVLGGEALNLSELKSWVERHGDDLPVLVNMYGITETTVHVTYRRIRRHDIDENQGSVIGWPLRDLRVYLFDAYQQLVPIGTVGEMYVGGAGVARGYLNQPELTAARFIENSHVSGERIYRTGDLARYLPGGDLEYLGRLDDQVKIRGFRIELGEIEQQLSALTEVRSCVVLAREDVPGEKRLVAYVLPRDYQQAEAVEKKSQRVSCYREELSARLPDYMVPTVFVLLEALPLTANGKVDRKALPAPDAGVLGGEYVAPETEAERTLVQIWAELLKLKPESISVTANLFELGGHSLMLLKLVSEIRERFAVELAIKEVMEHAQVRLLAERVVEAGMKAVLTGAGGELEAGEMEVTI
jgi:amino acid adenylation domain-containing protein